MAWIEYHEQLRDHYKVTRLAAILNVPYPHALGLISCLWCYASGQARNGYLNRLSEMEIAYAARYEGEPKTFVKALKEVRFLDQNGVLHDWKKHGLRMLEQSRRRQERYRASVGESDDHGNASVTLQERDEGVTETSFLERKKERRVGLGFEGSSGVKEQPHQTIINRFLELKGTPREKLSKEQTTGAYKRHSRSALALISESGGLEYGLAALEWGAKYFDGKNLTWTLDTIAKHLPTFAKCGSDAELAKRYGLNPQQVQYASKLAGWYTARARDAGRGSAADERRVPVDAGGS